jgi:hypothetical protein
MVGCWAGAAVLSKFLVIGACRQLKSCLEVPKTREGNRSDATVTVTPLVADVTVQRYMVILHGGCTIVPSIWL